MVSDGARAMVSLALDMPQDHPEFEARRQRFLDLYAEDLGFATAPFPGIQSLLTALAESGRRWGISTNKPSYLAEPLMQRIGLAPPAASLVCPDHVSRPKPDPEPLLLNCEQLACEVHEVIYIGDHRRDIEAGRAAGMYTIAAAYGYIHAEDDPHEWGADTVADTPQALLDLVTAAFTE